MAYGVCIPNKIAATNIDTLNRAGVIAGADLENGSVVQLLTKSATAGEGEVWTATQAAGGSGLQNLWMVYSPEIVTTVSGSYNFKGLDPDPRNFLNLRTKPFDAFKPQLGDIITLTGDVITGSVNDYAVATASDYQLNWGAGAVSGLSLKKIATTYISIPSGSLGETQRVDAYMFEVVAIA